MPLPAVEAESYKESVSAMAIVNFLPHFYIE